MERDHEPYIPCLPDDLALDCLLRVSPRSHHALHNVSWKWRNLVTSAEFYEQRRREGASQHYLCHLQAAPHTDPEHHPPVYCISVVDTTSRCWERLPPIPELAPLGVPVFSRLASAPGKLLVLGGWHPATQAPLTSVYIFSFTSRTWRRGADMPTPRSFFACSSISQSHHIVVAGGHDHTTKAPLATAEIYNTSTDSWRSLPSMASPRDECTGVSESGTFLVIGGYDSKFISSGEIYNPETNAWTTVQEMCGASASNAVVTSQGMFAFRGRELVRYSDKWEVVDHVPSGKDGISEVASAAGFGCGVAVTGPCSDDEEKCRSLVYRLGAWEAVPQDDDFVGATLASCAVEC